MLQIASTMDDRGSVEAIRPVASPMDYLYLTFRTVQAAGAFRRRLKTRVQSSRAAANPHSYECKAEFASTAEKGIRRCLSRVEAEAAIGKHCAAEPSDRVSSGLLRETIATTSRPGDDDDVDDVAAVDSTTKPDCEVPTTRRVRSEKSVEPTHAKLRLETLAKAVQFGVSNRLSLAEAAADDIVFLQQRDDVICFKAWSLDQTLRKLFLVDTALRRLYLAECDQQTRSVPANYDLCNQKFIANLKHLLLRLRESLVQDAATKLYDPIKEEAVRDRQREQQRRKLELDTLFTEFKDNRRPLSTTWPWSIKPSLAVLWGVCWMFFNSPPQEQQTPFDDGNGFNNELYSGANFGLPPYQAPSQPTVDNSRLGLDPTQTTANLGSELEFAGDMSVLGTGRMPDAAPLRRTSALGPGFEFAQPRPGLRQQRTDQGRPGLGRSLLAHSQPQRQANSARESRVGVHEYGGETWVLEPKCNGSGIASSVPDSQRINAPALAATLSNFDFLPHQPGIRSEQPKSPPVWQQPRLGESYQVPSPATASGAPLGHSFQVPTSVTQGATLTAFEGVGGTTFSFSIRPFHAANTILTG
ncbi:hypothetical protein BDY21DRAFT_157005 [Lineolata rhizophorae]|uniref:Uncharacterized protein n=1 Tax=Lineolata rhizophorae TaxID=578093 RepID=A0A6A6NN20_9PEZI|nr:hypothetical protein BDY21DRAFT_157005 [Lineolata rhizophorae]